MRMLAVIDDLTPNPTRVQRQLYFFNAEDFPDAREEVSKYLKSKWADRTFTVSICLVTYPGIQLST